MNIMGIAILLGVLLCVAILGMIMLCCLLEKEMEDRTADKQQFNADLREARRRVEVTHVVEFFRAPRRFYDQAKENAAGGNDTDDVQ